MVGGLLHGTADDFAGSFQGSFAAVRNFRTLAVVARQQPQLRSVASGTKGT